MTNTTSLVISDKAAVRELASRFFKCTTPLEWPTPRWVSPNELIQILFVDERCYEIQLFVREPRVTSGFYTIQLGEIKLNSVSPSQFTAVLDGLMAATV